MAVNLRQVSKTYRLYDSKLDRLKESLDPRGRIYHHDFKALDRIDLDIEKGQTFGVLGRNGSGKSTLLQIIASVLTPTAGTVEVSGRVAALLELGAGFNNQLTGRENVAINLAIMGFKGDEIPDRTVEIQDFADVGEFFDQPMRIYSSGMFARVAFGMSIHVDPDILIVDEALAVGDAKFQEKCFRKFRSFQSEGVTVIYVTHDRSSVVRLCTSAMLLERGQIVDVGDPKYVSELYNELLSFGRVLPGAKIETSEEPDATIPSNIPTTGNQTASLDHVSRFLSERVEGDNVANNPTYNKYEHRYGNGRAKINDFLIVSGQTMNPASIESGSVVNIFFKVKFYADLETPVVGLEIKNKEGVVMYGVNSDWIGSPLEPVKAGEVKAYRFQIKMALAAGDWFLDLAVAENPEVLCDCRTAASYMYLTDVCRYSGFTRLESEFEEVYGRDASGPAQTDVSAQM